MRKLAVGAVCLAASAVAPVFAQAQQVIRLTTGQTRSLVLPENPSTGYSWAIDPAASKGLDIVAIIDSGHRRGGPLIGAPGTRHWTVRALMPGHAEIVFDCRRPWEPAPVDTRRVVVDVARQP